MDSQGSPISPIRDSKLQARFSDFKDLLTSKTAAAKQFKTVESPQRSHEKENKRIAGIINQSYQTYMKLNADLKSELHSDLQSLHDKWKTKDITLDEDSDIALGLALGVAIESTKNKPRFTNPFTEHTNKANNSPMKSLSTILCNDKIEEKCKTKGMVHEP